VSLADKGVLTAVGEGVVKMDVFHQGTWVPVVLAHVYHIPNLGGNFFSVKTATSRGLRVLFESTQFLVLR